MIGVSGKTLRAMVICMLVLGVLAGAGGSAPAVRAQQTTQGTQATTTFPTSLAVDQASGFVFVTTGDFDNQTAGAAGPGRLLVLATRGSSIQLTRSVPVGSGPATVLVDERAGRVLVVNLGGGDQYAGYTGSSVNVLDLTALEHGSQIPMVRTMPLRGQLAQQVAIDRTTGRIFVATWALATTGQVGKGSVYVLDTRTGALLHTVTLNTLAQTLAVDEASGDVFVLQGGSASGSGIAVLDARTGKVVRTFLADRTAAPLGVDGRTGHVFVATLQGLQMRSTRDGALLRTVTLGQTPATIAVDAQHHHVFVVTQGTQGSNGQYVTNGTLCMLDASTGALLGRVAVGIYLPFLQMVTGTAPPTVAVTSDGNRVFVANNTSVGKGSSLQRRGTISVIEVTGTGLQLLRTTPVAANGATVPLALGVNTSTNKVFAATLTPTTAGSSTIGLASLDGRTGALLSAIPLPTRSVAQTMARSGQTATLLADGQVLVAGGNGVYGVLASALLYTPATGRWTATGRMHTPRSGQTATLLPDGRVLVAGRFNRSVTLASAEIYEPKTGTWAPTGSLDGALSSAP